MVSKGDLIGLLRPDASAILLRARSGREPGGQVLRSQSQLHDRCLHPRRDARCEQIFLDRSDLHPAPPRRICASGRGTADVLFRTRGGDVLRYESDIGRYRRKRYAGRRNPNDTCLQNPPTQIVNAALRVWRLQIGRDTGRVLVSKPVAACPRCTTEGGDQGVSSGLRACVRTNKNPLLCAEHRARIGRAIRPSSPAWAVDSTWLAYWVRGRSTTPPTGRRPSYLSAVRHFSARPVSPPSASTAAIQ